MSLQDIRVTKGVNILVWGVVCTGVVFYSWGKTKRNSEETGF